MSIDKYKSENPINRWISQSGFGAYDIPSDGSGGIHKMSRDIFTIEIDDLTTHSNNFFIWVMNLSMIRMYSSLELLLLRTIRSTYFPSIQDPIIGKQQTNKAIEEIKIFLKCSGQAIDTKNNRYILAFLKLKSSEANSFFGNSINSVNWKTNWESFYEFFSILRNVIAHHGMLISPSIRNELNSKAGDILNHFFEQPIDRKETEILKPKDEQHFLNFTILVSDFAANTVKFIAGQNTLSFIGLR